MSHLPSPPPSQHAKPAVLPPWLAGPAERIEGPAWRGTALRIVPLAAGSAHEYWAGAMLLNDDGSVAQRCERWFATAPFVHPSDALEYAAKSARRLWGQATPVGH